MGISRRDAIKAAVATAIGLGTGTIAYGIAYERHRIGRTDLDLRVTGLPAALDGLRIGLITDVHHSESVSAADVSLAVALLAEAKPDLTVLGGDYVTFGDRKFVGPVAELLSPLAHSPQGSFAVLGNHDDDRDMPAALAQRGFTVLKDQRTSLTIRGETLDLAGIRFWTRRPSDLARVLAGTSGTTILLAHDPRRLVEAAALDVQLVLSGHTHGGQVRAAWSRRSGGKKVSGAGRARQRRERHGVRQPRRRHGLRAGPHQLPARSGGTDTTERR